ncbi:MarR family winged helix-turn-helix transcriptional regulator [Bradyrhizobium sp. USDA 4473]
MHTIELSKRHGRLFHMLQLAAHRLRKVADRKVMAVSDLTATQATILHIIATREAIMQKQIAKLLGQNESAVAGMVTRLLSLGLIDRCRRQEDARASMLRLTEAGRIQLAATKPAFDELDGMLDGTLTFDELDQLSLLLERVVTDLSVNDSLSARQRRART